MFFYRFPLPEATERKSEFTQPTLVSLHARKIAQAVLKILGLLESQHVSAKRWLSSGGYYMVRTGVTVPFQFLQRYHMSMLVFFANI